MPHFHIYNIQKNCLKCPFFVLFLRRDDFDAPKTRVSMNRFPFRFVEKRINHSTNKTFLVRFVKPYLRCETIKMAGVETENPKRIDSGKKAKV
jgi:hypothetical protein